MFDDEFKRLDRTLGGHAFVETNKRMFGAWTHQQHGSLSTKGVRLEQACQIADAENFKSISIRFFIRIGK